MIFDTSYSLLPLLETTLFSSSFPTLLFHLPTPSYPPIDSVISFCTVFLPCAKKLFIDSNCKHCRCDLLLQTVSAYFYFQNCNYELKMSNYGNFDVRSRDDPQARALEQRNPSARYDLPRPFRPQPIPEGQVERRFMGPVNTPATIATRHREVVQAVENFTTRCPDVARRYAEAGASFRRHWEEGRAAEMEEMGAAEAEEAREAEDERGAAPADSPEAEPEVARPPAIYVDDIAADISDDLDDLEDAPPYARRRADRGAAAGTGRGGATARSTYPDFIVALARRRDLYRK